MKACSNSSTEGAGASGSIRLARGTRAKSSSDIAARAQLPQRGEPHGRQARRLDRRHVPARTLDAEDLDRVAVEVGKLRLQRGVAAAMQDQPWIRAKQPRGVDAQREVARHVTVARD